MRVFLLNPSDDSFGTAGDHPALDVCAGLGHSGAFRRADAGGRDDRGSCDRRFSALATWWVSASTRPMRGAGWNWADWRASGGPGSSSAASMRRCFPKRPWSRAGAHAVVKGDGDQIWQQALADCEAGTPQRIYDGGRVSGAGFAPARWELINKDNYMWASGADGARLPEVLQLLLGLAHRRPETTPARSRSRGPGNRRNCAASATASSP